MVPSQGRQFLQQKLKFFIFLVCQKFQVHPFCNLLPFWGCWPCLELGPQLGKSWHYPYSIIFWPCSLPFELSEENKRTSLYIHLQFATDYFYWEVHKTICLLDARSTRSYISFVQWASLYVASTDLWSSRLLV